MTVAYVGTVTHCGDKIRTTDQAKQLVTPRELNRAHRKLNQQAAHRDPVTIPSLADINLRNRAVWRLA